MAPRPKRWRFSLATILLLLTIAALVVSHVRMSRQLAVRDAQVQVAQAEVEMLWKEVGYLDVTDKTKLHIVATPPHLDMVWRWKVFVPAAQPYQIHSLIKRSSGGSATSTSLLQAGASIVEYAIYKGPQGNWKGKLTVVYGGATASTGSPLPDWFDSIRTSRSGLLHADGTHQYEVDRPVTLLDLTATPSSPDEAATDQDVPETTIKVWVEPVKKASN